MDTGSDLHRHGGSGAESAKAVDPVCGMTVDPQTAKHQSIHDGHPYFFCCGGCKSKFEADPDRYINKDQKNASCTCTASEAKNAAVTDPVCGMTVDPHKAKHRVGLRRAPLLLLQRRMQGEV